MSESAQTTEFNYSKRQLVFGIISIFAVYSSMSYAVQSLGIARPRVAAELDGMALYHWAVSIPALLSAFATLIFGKFSDMYGRRVMLMITLVISFVGTTLTALSPNFTFMIVVSAIGAIGSGAMMPLTFSVVGDLFPPEKRGKWIGLLNIPVGVFSLIGPTLGGWFVDNPNLGWRWLYWISLPLLVICLLTTPIGVPSVRSATRGKIDVLGCILVGIASSATIIGLSFAGDRYAWDSWQIISLLGGALVFWVLFIRAENRAEEPILDPQVFRNRSFLTVSVSSLLAGFGQMGMLMYFVMFLQGVQLSSDFEHFITPVGRLFGFDIGHTAISGLIITPMSVLMAFISVPVGFIMGKSKHFKWMYVAGYGILTAVMFGVISLGAESSQWLSLAAAALAGAGLGALPPLNTMVVQNAVPQKLLGVAMGAFFFCMLMGGAISPAVLGSAMNSTYREALTASLPEVLKDGDFQKSVGDPKVLLNPEELKVLEADFAAKGRTEYFPQTVETIRDSMAAGVRSVFWVSAVTMLVAFLLICTLPEKKK
ncbi:MAG: MFS transporter [Acidobacteriota bacterium]|jgi:MFS family permease|nr:MFS transporter [Acidobacteriota bacterium]